MINLNDRLRAIYDSIEPCRIIADIGSDHGKIPIKAVLEGKASMAIASDISAKSLRKAVELKTKTAADTVSCRVGNGLMTLSADEYDAVVVTGMGGLEIVDILSKAIQKFNQYILLPHGNARELREYLSMANIKPFVDRMLLCNGQFYNLLVCRSGDYTPSDTELTFGIERIGEVYSSYIKRELNRLNKIINKVDEEARIIYLAQLVALKEQYESIGCS